MSHRYAIVQQTGLGKANVLVWEDDDKNKAQVRLQELATKLPGVTFTMYAVQSETTYTPPKPSQGTFATKQYGE